MNKSVQNILWTILPVTLVMTASGCATKKYARTQAGVVNQRVSAIEAKTNERIAYLSAKEQADISRVDERITTTDAKLAGVASTAEQANATASQANQMAQANQSTLESDSAKIAANTTGIAALGTLAQNAWNYQLIEKADVTFGFDKSRLDNDAKVALDMLVEKAKAMPRAVLEIDGFTDKVGSASYNLALSRRRADAVARYLVSKDIPLRSINVIGLGEEAPPPSLTADLKAVDPGARPADVRRLARRVLIRVYAPATAIAGEAARSEDPPQQ